MPTMAPRQHFPQLGAEDQNVQTTNNQYRYVYIILYHIISYNIISYEQLYIYIYAIYMQNTENSGLFETAASGIMGKS